MARDCLLRLDEAEKAVVIKQIVAHAETLVIDLQTVRAERDDNILPRELVSPPGLPGELIGLRPAHFICDVLDTHVSVFYASGLLRTSTRSRRVIASWSPPTRTAPYCAVPSTSTTSRQPLTTPGTWRLANICDYARFAVDWRPSFRTRPRSN